jgi:hypothetical protein
MMFLECHLDGGVGWGWGKPAGSPITTSRGFRLGLKRDRLLALGVSAVPWCAKSVATRIYSAGRSGRFVSSGNDRFARKRYPRSSVLNKIFGKKQ